MPFNIDKHTGILIKKAARLFEQVANKDLDNLGVTYSQTIFLVRLWENDGQSQVDLAKSAGLKQPTTVRTLDRMERDGLITRVRNTEDRRVFNFYLTDRARKVCQKLEGYANSMHKTATKHISKRDTQTINKLLSVIITNLEDSLE